MKTVFDRILHLLSGGLDSTVLLYDLSKRQRLKVECVLFNYGQTHLKELEYAKWHCEHLRVPFVEVELYRLKGLFARCALTDQGSDDVIVPNRNAVFLNIAASMAYSRGIEMVSIGCNKDDQADFPDCGWDFIVVVNKALQAAKINVEVCAPYTGLTKWQIVQLAKEYKINIDKTWSCYNGGSVPCGKCLACRKLQEALR